MKKNVKIWVLLISVITFISGLAQILAPAIVLKFIGAEITVSTMQLFSTIGMFMCFFGGMMLQALYSPDENRIAIYWSAVQKFGASIAVIIGVAKGLFTTIALAVALFDVFSGFILIYYIISLKKE